MSNGTIRFSQIGLLTGLKRHAINARAKSAFENNALERSPGNQILLNPTQVKKLIEDRIIRQFLDLPGTNIPSAQTMRNDIPAFITNTYKKLFNRNPNEFEKYYLKKMIQNDTTITSQMMYYSFMTSNEYRYY